MTPRASRLSHARRRFSGAAAAFLYLLLACNAALPFVQAVVPGSAPAHAACAMKTCGCPDEARRAGRCCCFPDAAPKIPSCHAEGDDSPMPPEIGAAEFYLASALCAGASDAAPPAMPRLPAHLKPGVPVQAFAAFFNFTLPEQAAFPADYTSAPPDKIPLAFS